MIVHYTQNDSKGFNVFCDTKDCDRQITIVQNADGLPKSDGEIRSAILAKGWYIDMHAKYSSILVGNEENTEWGLPPETLAGLLVNRVYKLDDDDHYCCLDCAGEGKD